MATLVLPRANLKRILRPRRLRGQDRRDEVWNGVYVMHAPADNDHQIIIGKLTTIVWLSLGGLRDDVRCFAGTNVSDRTENWAKNYRVPDVAVFLPGNPAEDRASHWLGGPDFAVEVVSKGDRSRKKLDFYSKVGVRELLLVERGPWRLELFRAVEGKLTPVGTSDLKTQETIASEVLPLSFRLIDSTPRPRIEATRPSDSQVWLI